MGTWSVLGWFSGNWRCEIDALGLPPRGAPPAWSGWWRQGGWRQGAWWPPCASKGTSYGGFHSHGGPTKMEGLWGNIPNKNTVASWLRKPPYRYYLEVDIVVKRLGSWGLFCPRWQLEAGASELETLVIEPGTMCFVCLFLRVPLNPTKKIFDMIRPYPTAPNTKTETKYLLRCEKLGVCKNAFE